MAKHFSHAQQEAISQHVVDCATARLREVADDLLRERKPYGTPDAARKHNPRVQELESEQSLLQSELANAQAQLTKLRSPPTEAEIAKAHRRELAIRSAVRQERESCQLLAQRFEQQGDYRQAMIWRHSILGLRARFEQEIT